MTTTSPTPTRRRAKFNALTVASVQPLTESSVKVSFDIPEELREDYNYLPGQYVALRRDFDGQEVRRSYSICDVSDPTKISVGIKKDLGGLFSTWANEELEPGMTIEVMNPQGAFTSKVHVTGMNNPEQLVDAETARTSSPHIVSFAAGSGITPVMAISRAFLERTGEASVELVYSNKGQNDVMFAEEIGDLKDKYPTRLAAHHILTRENRPNPLYSGRLDQEKLDILLDRVIDTERVDEWFLCGPFEFVQMIRDTLAARDVPAEKVRFELFTTGDPADGPSPSPSAWTAPSRPPPRRSPPTRPSSTRRCAPARTCLTPAPAACAAPAAPRSCRARSRWMRTTRWRRTKSRPATS